MQPERYTHYTHPEKPHVEWTDNELFDEVDFIATHRINIGATGERDVQLKKRMAQATLEQMIRYNERRKDD